MKKCWQFKAAEKDKKKSELLIYGPLSDVSWFGDEVTPRQFNDDLKALGDIEELDIFINSPGGDVFAGQAIYSMLSRHKAKKTVYVDGLAASAASLVAMAGNNIVMYANSLLMIHNPWSFAMGYSSDMRKMADDLDKIREAMIPVYTAKSGLSDEEIVAIMDAETWLTGKEAVEKGFADEVVDAKEVAASLSGGQATINGQVVDISQFKNFPQDKLEAIASATQARAEQAAREERRKETEAQARHRARLRDLDVMELRH